MVSGEGILALELKKCKQSMSSKKHWKVIFRSRKASQAKSLGQGKVRGVEETEVTQCACQGDENGDKSQIRLGGHRWPRDRGPAGPWEGFETLFKCNKPSRNKVI